LSSGTLLALVKETLNARCVVMISADNIKGNYESRKVFSFDNDSKLIEGSLLRGWVTLNHAIAEFMLIENQKKLSKLEVTNPDYQEEIKGIKENIRKLKADINTYQNIAKEKGFHLPIKEEWAEVLLQITGLKPG
jgi:hypothetical protein